MSMAGDSARIGNSLLLSFVILSNEFSGEVVGPEWAIPCSSIKICSVLFVRNMNIG
jgi:hypothetical protein